MDPPGQLPRRILFATAGLTIGGGIANLANSTLRALDQFVADGAIDRVDILILHGDAPLSRPHQNAEVALAGSSNHRFAMMYARRGRNRRVDLTIFDMAGIARSAKLLPPFLRSPFVVFGHGQEFDPPIRDGLAWPISHATKILAVSGTTGQRLRRIEMPAPLAPIEIVAPCVARDRIETWSRSESAGGVDLGPMILTVGRLIASDPGKGQDTLIRALPLVRERVPNARLVIVGDGDNRSALGRMAAECGTADNVTLGGLVSDEELGRLYRSAAVFAMPSQQEGFGIVYAEAMWHGLPCIGSTADAAADIIDHEMTGLLVPYGDVPSTAEALIRILGNPMYARTLGERGRAVCLDRYTPDAFRNRLRASLESISQ